MYKFTVLLNRSKNMAYLSGNNNCMPDLTLNEMYEIAINVENLSPTSPYVLWASLLESVTDFEFCIFYSESKKEVTSQAEAYARKMGCTNISKGRPSIAKEKRQDSHTFN
ncbi:hypothetical protein GCM10007978_17980 [Shewanella hanedai]|uniref:Uncharacterized protein n=1 Tax=Shewanella hanedai TaxID=25 RepID=A0A553JST9_SHEHA|nr:hypothetical protein [Shewanella hanedai]TRY15523.1 hypothetical protein FN961_05560 [Shewanella hanedai]GGI80472.1 hypothetical protein GCM10007978_17980 [Shewanella hanedai]